VSPSRLLRVRPNYTQFVQQPPLPHLPPSTNDPLTIQRSPTHPCSLLSRRFPSRGRPPPNHGPRDPIAASPLDPAIALSIVLPRPPTSHPPHPSTPRHLAPSTPLTPSHHRSRSLSPRRHFHYRPLTNQHGGNRRNRRNEGPPPTPPPPLPLPPPANNHRDDARGEGVNRGIAVLSTLPIWRANESVQGYETYCT
jgi:hypothetical protein